MISSPQIVERARINWWKLADSSRWTVDFAVAGLLLCLANFAHGQNWQFGFDGNGNLFTQAGEDIEPPQILGEPQLQVVPPGALASFFVVAANTRGLAYEWRFNGASVPGAIGDALLLTNVSAANEGQYSVVLSNISGSVTSTPAALLLDGDGDGLPDPWELANFGNLNQYPTGDADGDGVSNLDEFLDGTNPADNASVRYRLTVLSNGGLVDVVPSRLSYTNGEVVTLTATAFSPNTFRGWTGDTNTTSNPITLTMTSNKTVFAHQGSENLVWNTGNGDWHVASNWEPSIVPTMNDNVFITSGATVTINSTAECRNLSIGDANSGPTLTGAGTLTTYGVATWERGTMSGTGRTIIAPGSTLHLVNAVGVNLTTRTLENGGKVIWTSGFISMSAAVITNRAGALFENRGIGGLSFNGGASRFDNAGTFRKSVNPGTMAVTASVGFNNYGTVEIQTGTLTLSGGGTHTGTFDLPAGTTLNLAGGTHNASAASSITGAGNFTVNGGTVTLGGLVNVTGNHLFDSGTANLTGNYFCTNNTLSIAGGTANFNGAGTVTPSVVNLSSGTLGGSQVVTVLGEMNWSGGTMSGTGRTIIPAGVTLNVANAVNLTTRTLENGGTVIWTSGSISMSAGVITNRAGALFENRGIGGLSFNGGASRFDNAGTFRKSVNPGTMAVTTSVGFNNYGTVEIQAGTLTLSGGGTHTGTFDLPAGTTLNLAGGTHNASAASSITGAGNFTVNGGTVTLGGLVNVTGNHLFDSGTANLTGNYFCTNNTLSIAGGTANFNGAGTVTPSVVNLSSGTLGGSQVVTVLGEMNWSGGTMSGTGRTIIPAGVTLNVANATGVNLTTRTLENGGTVIWTTGYISMSGAVITNRAGAVFENRGVGGLAFNGGSSRFDNAGAFRKTVNTGTASVSGNIAFNNYGAVEIRSGILAMNGGYTSTANSLLNCAIGGTTVGTGYGRLQVAGAVTLNGALSVDLINGFVPVVNDSFTVLTAGSRNGTFANFYFPSNAVTMQLSNSPNSVIVRVTEVLVIPQPTLLQPELLGPDIRLTWTAVSNLTYRLEFNPDLNPSNWTALPGDVIGVSNTASKLDALTSSNRLYRVRVIP